MTAPWLRRSEPIVELQAGAAVEATEQLAVQSADLAAARGEVVDLRSRAASLRKEVTKLAANPRLYPNTCHDPAVARGQHARGLQVLTSTCKVAATLASRLSCTFLRNTQSCGDWHSLSCQPADP